MRIDKLHIKNFKGFADNTFAFNPNFTVFIGGNATGKTSVLDALAIAISAYLHGLDVARHEAVGVSKHEIRSKIVEGQAQAQLPVVIEASGIIDDSEFQDGWIRNIDTISKKATTKFVKAKRIEKKATEMLHKSRTTGGIIFPLIAYHGTGRLWAEHSIKNVQKIAYRKKELPLTLGYFRCLSPKSSSKEFLSWYKTHEDEVRKFNRPTDIDLLNIFNECICQMIPNGEWQNMSFSFLQDTIIGSFTTPQGTQNELLFNQLSDGYRNVISLIADLACRCIRLNPQLGVNAIKDTPGIVLIDELDLHLHPKWQKRIVADLKRTFPKIQFVATTHSPFIVQSLKSDELVILDNIKNDGDPFRKGIEDLTEYEMGVTDTARSKTFMEMQNVAEEYYQLISKGKTSENDIRTRELGAKLDELEARFGEDPAFVAALKIERQAKGL